jgi:phosphomannomutase/phosphoglucomutase
MIRQQADLGVEASGHFFFKALRGGDDGLFAALLTGHVLTAMEETLENLIRPIGWPAITPELRVPLPAAADDLLDRLATQCGGEVSRLDGVRAQYADGWGLARRSITEPVITLRFEGSDQASLRNVAARFLAGAPELYMRIQESLL